MHTPIPNIERYSKGDIVIYLTVILVTVLIFSFLTIYASSEAALSVSARSAVLYEPTTDSIIYSKNADARLPMASTTKIMTALVVLRNSTPDEIVTVSPLAVGTEGSSVYLKEGEKLTVNDLLYAVMLESANDAAAALAIHVGGSIEGFAELMNETAESIGCENTHFTNPHGLDDEEHYTTAKDLAKITAEALRNEDFRKIVSTVKHTIPQKDGGVRLLLNHNRLLREKTLPGGGTVIGVKTGFTKRSGRCLVTAAERDGVTVIAVTISAPDDWNDHRALLSFGLDSYECVTLADVSSLSFAVPVVGGDVSFVTVENEDPIRIIRKKESGEITKKVTLDRFLFAPVTKGETLGVVSWYDENGNLLAEVPLIAQNGAERQKNKTFKDKIAEIFR